MKIIIIGNGGHSKVIQEIIRTQKDYHIIAILDDKYELVHQKDNTTYAPIAYLKKVITVHTKVVIAIGNNNTRKLLSEQFLIRADQFLTVVDPSAAVSKTATIGYGTVVMPGAYINAETTIGNHCIINTGAIVDHEVSIADYVHISPNATLTGNVSIGEGAHIGASTTIIPEVEIGNWSIVGAGSTVIRQIPPNSTAVGSPTRIVNKQGKQNMEIRL